MKAKIDLVKLAIGAIFFFILMWCALGCKIGEKAVKKYQASSAFPKACADSFPVKVDSIYVEGGWVTDTVWNYEVQTLFDTVTLKADTVTIKVKTINNKKVDTLKLTKELTSRLEAAIRKAKEDSTLAANNLNKAKEMHQKDTTLLRKYLADSERLRKRNGKQRNWLAFALGAIGAISFRHQILGFVGGPVAGGLTTFLGLFRRRRKK